MFDIQVNPQSFQDWSGLLKLLHDAFAYMDNRIDPPSSLHGLDLHGIESKAKQENFLIARQKDKLAGCAFFKSSNNSMYIGKVAVSNQYRQQGLAKKMFTLIEQKAVAENLEYPELETRVELIENHLTFASLGFVKVGESAHAGYDRPTSITMRKKL